MDSSRYTHVLNIMVGIDLTEILKPAYIPGVKKYLGVESDADLLKAVISDKFKNISEAIHKEGLVVLSGEVNPVNSQQENVTSQGLPENNFKEKDKYKDNNGDSELTYNSKLVIQSIKKSLKEFQENNCEITSITIDKNLASELHGTADIYVETNLDKSVPVEFEEVDDNTLMVISYVDSDQKIKYQIIDKFANVKQEGN